MCARPEFHKHILVIGVRMLTPDIDGGSLRVFRLLTILRELSCSLTFIARFPRSWPPYTDRLQQDSDRLREIGVQVPPVGSVEEHLRQHGSLYDIVILYTENVAEFADCVRRHVPQAALLFDTSDLSHIRFYREAKVTGSVRALRLALRAKRRELAAVERVDCTLVVSPEEKSVLERECPGARVHIVTNVHEVRGSARPFLERKDILFVGSFEHAPNLDAVGYFVREVFPLIRKEIPGVKFYVVGHNPPDYVRDLACDDVILTGHVPDVSLYLDRCRLSVAPLRFGSGVKIKVLTSMGHGVPVVATTVGAEGMCLTHGKDVLVADGPEDFCRAVVALYQDAHLWDRLSRNGLEVISRRFSLSAVRASLVELLEEVDR